MLYTYGETSLDFLVEAFSVFGVEAQYWMPLAVAIIAVTIVAARTVEKRKRP
jgi:hypothetical protein